MFCVNYCLQVFQRVMKMNFAVLTTKRASRGHGCVTARTTVRAEKMNGIVGIFVPAFCCCCSAICYFKTVLHPGLYHHFLRF